MARVGKCGDKVDTLYPASDCVIIRAILRTGLVNSPGVFDADVWGRGWDINPWGVLVVGCYVLA